MDISQRMPTWILRQAVKQGLRRSSLLVWLALLSLSEK